MTVTTTVTPAAGEQQAEPSTPAGPDYRRRRRVRRVLVYAVLIAGVIPTVLPFIWLVRSALMDNNQMFIAPPEWIPRPFEWANFSGALTAQPFARYFLNTMIIEVFRRASKPWQ